MASFHLCSVIHISPITVISHRVLRNSASPTLAHAGLFSKADFTLVPSPSKTQFWGSSKNGNLWRFQRKTKINCFFCTETLFPVIFLIPWENPRSWSQVLNCLKNTFSLFHLCPRICSCLCPSLPVYSVLSPMPQRGRVLSAQRRWVPRFGSQIRHQ